MRENQKEIEALTAALASGWDIEKADALASRLASRGGVRANLGRFGEALADLVRSVELFTRLVVDDGQDALEPKLALARLNRGISLCNTGRVEEGAADFEAAAAIYRRRIDECGEGDHRDMLETTTRNLQIAQQHIAQSRVRQGGAPMYDPAAVQPMREELTRLGVRELLTPEDVDATLGSNQGTALLVINSVCGCAAGGARPGVALALQNTTIPDELTTVFAGMERDAVDRAREHLDGLPPSSPFIAILKDGAVVAAMQRGDIEGREPGDIATTLAGYFDEHCSRQGPSIPREEFEQLESIQKMCGSKVPPFLG